MQIKLALAASHFANIGTFSYGFGLAIVCLLYLIWAKFCIGSNISSFQLLNYIPFDEKIALLSFSNLNVSFRLELIVEPWLDSLLDKLKEHFGVAKNKTIEKSVKNKENLKNPEILVGKVGKMSIEDELDANSFAEESDSDPESVPAEKILKLTPLADLANEQPSLICGRMCLIWFEHLLG